MNLKVVLKNLMTRFHEQDMDFVLCGGLALSTMGIQRLTKDIDRPASRKPRPLGRGQGELSKNGQLPYREAPPFKGGGFTFLLVKNPRTQSIRL